MSRLSWKKQPNEKGLAKVIQGPRGYHLWYGDEKIATVQHSRHGWFYYAGSEKHSVPRRNTASEPSFADKESAKADCDAYVKKHFKKG